MYFLRLRFQHCCFLSLVVRRTSQVSPGKTNDPEGTVTVNLRNEGWQYRTKMGKIVKDQWDSKEDCEIFVSPANNLIPYCNSGQQEIVYLGKGTSLGSINTDKLPDTGWAKETAALVGGLYIVHFHTWWYYDSTQFDNDVYFGLQVVDTLLGTDEGILGYTVKYCPFTPGKGWDQ